MSVKAVANRNTELGLRDARTLRVVNLQSTQQTAWRRESPPYLCATLSVIVPKNLSFIGFWRTAYSTLRHAVPYNPTFRLG